LIFHRGELRGPVRIGRIHLELGKYCLGYAVEQSRLIRRMPVQDHWIPVKDAGPTGRCSKARLLAASIRLPA
jgi:hypothetical protein